MSQISRRQLIVSARLPDGRRLSEVRRVRVRGVTALRASRVPLP